MGDKGAITKFFWLTQVWTKKSVLLPPHPWLVTEYGCFSNTFVCFYFFSEFSRTRVFIQINDAYVDYFVDTASLVELPDRPEWRAEAEERIENIRKNDVTLK